MVAAGGEWVKVAASEQQTLSSVFEKLRTKYYSTSPSEGLKTAGV